MLLLAGIVMSHAEIVDATFRPIYDGSSVPFSKSIDATFRSPDKKRQRPTSSY